MNALRQAASQRPHQSQVRPAKLSRGKCVGAKCMTGDAPSSSGRDGGLSCSGKPQGFGGLRKNFKPQQKKKAPSVPAPNSQTLNGRSKADVLRELNADVAAKIGAGATGSTASAGSVDWAEDWKRVDAKVNTYPCERLFTAVGSGGEDFRVAMVRCVEEVVGGAAPVPCDTRSSSKGAYLSVRVGPVRVENRDQVLAIFMKMREDKRLKFHL